MIGIIGAMRLEVSEIRSMLTGPEDETVGGIRFTKGYLGNEEAVVAVCGIGKVFAAVCAQTMILRYHPDRILNVGVAGSLDPDLKVCDLVVAESAVQHDMDTSPLGDPKGMLSGLDLVYIPCDETLVERIREAALACGLHVKTGIVASGDQFVALPERKKEIREQFGASACEMEGAAIGQVCCWNRVPFCIVRAISDGADGDGGMDYVTFCEAAAKNTSAVVRKLFAVDPAN